VAQRIGVLTHASIYFVYIGIARFVLTYIYTSLFTKVAYHFTRNIRRAYLRSALSQDISFFDHGSGGSIAMQGNSNGKLIQSGVAEKLGLSVQAAATFVTAFVIAFVSQWKLTLIISCIIPVLFIVVGGASALDAGIEVKNIEIYGQAGSYTENILAGVRTVTAFSLQSRIIEKYKVYLQEISALGKKKNVLYGVMFGGEYFAVFAGMGLAFWQGIAMVARGEADGVGTIFTYAFLTLHDALANAFTASFSLSSSQPARCFLSLRTSSRSVEPPLPLQSCSP
jgi:ATP-binding cassette subfamily B (MDR/TAP) protein 1